jgi:hypothetical protein
MRDDESAQPAEVASPLTPRRVDRAPEQVGNLPVLFDEQRDRVALTGHLRAVPGPSDAETRTRRTGVS